MQTFQQHKTTVSIGILSTKNVSILSLINVLNDKL